MVELLAEVLLSLKVVGVNKAMCCMRRAKGCNRLTVSARPGIVHDPGRQEVGWLNTIAGLELMEPFWDRLTQGAEKASKLGHVTLVKVMSADVRTSRALVRNPDHNPTILKALR
jgi:hypothetical protein